jgi:small subunit ribosomal protein S20
MPIKQAAKKALRQTVKHTLRNKTAKAEIHSLRVKLRKLLADKKVKEAGEAARMLGKKLDKAQAKGIMKKNTVARLKSRMMAPLNALSKNA